jgi:drug/metabolite transporter (DMT)-like permease
MGVFEILTFRTAIAFLIVLAMVARAGTATLRTRRMGVHLWRNGFHVTGQAAWVYAIGVLPLATVFAIEFTMPVWTGLLAALFLGERITRPRLVMVAMGFAGVLVILRPGTGVFQWASLVMLVGALCYAVQMIGTKQLSTTDSPLAVLFWMSVIQTPVSFLFALPGWVAPQPPDWPWLAAIGIGSFTAHYSLTRAMRLADASVVTPVDFFRLPLIAVVGALFYGEAFDPMVMLGAAFMFAGTYYFLISTSGPKSPVVRS